MDIAINEQKLYSLQHAAVNEPKRYIAEFEQTKGTAIKLPSFIRSMFCAKALFVTGNIQSGLKMLSDIQPEILEYRDDLCLGKYYLTLHSALANIHAQSDKANEYLLLAKQHAKQSGSKALRCEIQIQEILKADSSMPLDMKEDMLQEAMQYALESEILELRLDVYLASCPVFISANMPERVNRDLRVMLDTLDVDNHPHHLAQIYNYLGIVHLMLKDYPQSEDYLQKSLQLCVTKYYRHLHANTLINYGLCMMLRGDIQQAIDIYSQCRDMFYEFGMEHSANANKVQGNLARALGIAGRLEEACTTMRSSIQNYRKVNEQMQENTQKVNLADILVEQGEYTEAEQILNETIDYFTLNECYRYLSSANLCKARMFEAKEQYKEAFEAMEQVYRADQRYFSENFREESAQHQARIDKLRTEYLQLKNHYDTDSELQRFCQSTELVGEHPSIKKAIKDALLAARYPYTNVIITGESGTGKEVIARIIHNESKTGKPLVAINASAISPNLIESELFGHKKGAFTGAVEDRKGKFLLADNGTLFLDEISDMPLPAQVKLLRAIESHTIQPVGSDKDISVNCRIICTSNKNIRSLIDSKEFRLDLYHRLNKVEIHLLPLRERLSDLELLTDYYVESISQQLRVPRPTLTDSFYCHLKGYSFPGNIRELANLIERIFILSSSNVWDARTLNGILPEAKTVELSAIRPVSQHLRNTEAQLILDALTSCHWVQKEAAKMLNMSESTLSRHIKKLKITKP